MLFSYINQVEESQQLKIAIGIRDLDQKYSDYLREIAHAFSKHESPSIACFVGKVNPGSESIVFISKKGVELKGQIRREIIALYNSVYGEGWVD